MLLNKRTAESYTPLYLLASLGAGGMAIAVYLHLMFLTPHPATPAPVPPAMTAPVLAQCCCRRLHMGKGRPAKDARGRLRAIRGGQSCSRLQ